MNAARLGLYAGRTVQVGLGLVATVLTLGAMDMSAIQAVAVGVYALVMLAFIGALEIVVVRPLGRRGGAS